MQSANTFKTIARYFLSLIQRYTRLPLTGNKVDGISNFLKIDESIATAGQPTEAQFQLIRNAGFNTVINLAPQTSANALPNERITVETLGMNYVYIPVDFKNPTDSDFESFCNAMREVNSKPVFVHCAANMRVSAFVYRYRCQIRGVDRRIAAQDLQKIWNPTGVWKSFIEEV